MNQFNERWLAINQIASDTKKGTVGKVGACKAHIYQMIAQGLFPRPVKFGRRSLWKESEIDEAIERLKAEQREVKKKTA